MSKSDPEFEYHIRKDSHEIAVRLRKDEWIALMVWLIKGDEDLNEHGQKKALAAIENLHRQIAAQKTAE